MAKGALKRVTAGVEKRELQLHRRYQAVPSEEYADCAHRLLLSLKFKAVQGQDRAGEGPALACRDASAPDDEENQLMSL